MSTGDVLTEAPAGAGGTRLIALLRDAAAWRLLGRLFECPSESWRADVTALAAEVRDADLAGAAASALDEASEGLYHSLFGPGGPAPPREVSYHDTLELGSVMSSLAGLYEAFGYRPALLESPDHVAVEIGFVAFLRTKEAYAVMAGDAEHQAVAREAADGFQARHLANVADRLAAHLVEAPVEYLRTASRVLARRVGPRPGPKLLPVIQPPIDDGAEFACDA
ncbi:MAG: molecular chaperone TorD family protein [Vicinamibacterales bacterium]